MSREVAITISTNKAPVTGQKVSVDMEPGERLIDCKPLQMFTNLDKSDSEVLVLVVVNVVRLTAY